MRRTIPILLGLIASLACRDYNLERHVAGQAGLVQAIAVAIGREFARPYNSGPEAQAEIATTYARNKFGADIVDITPDPLGHRLTVTFKSGWRTAIVPIDDGKTGDDTKVPS
jgi:hypothetical protein